MGFLKDVLVWSSSDLSATPTLGSTFTVTGTPDLMAFSDDEAGQVPGDFDPLDLNQTLSGTLEGVDYDGNNGTGDAFEFELAFQVTDGVNTFNVYQIDNGSLGDNTVAYVSEYPLDPNVTYTVNAVDVTVNVDNGTGYEATPVWGDLAGQVDGTSGNDTISSGFTDDDGDQIDGLDGSNDVILGEGGGDTITSGAGNDLIYGDHVDDLPAGTTEYVVEAFVRDFSFELESGSLRLGASEVSISGEPIEIRIIDNDPGADDDDIVNDVPTDQDQLIEINGVLYNFSPDFTTTYTGSDGNTYEMMIVDVDRNRDGTIDNYSATTDAGDLDYEHGQILIPIGAVPPPGVTLTAGTTGGTVSDPDYTTLNGGAEITNYDDSIDAGTGDDTVFGGRGDDIIAGGAGNDTIDAGTGSDTIQLADGYQGDTITGGEDLDGLDIDTIDASGVTTDGVDVLISSGESGSLSSDEGTASFADIENFVLTEQADTFNGNFSASDMTVDGAGGDDVLRGGNGTNTLYGGTGEDLFHVGYGVDSIEGGAGTDTLSIDQSTDVIDLSFNGDGFGTFTDDDGDSGSFIEIEAVEGGIGNDTIDATATTLGVSLYGGGGTDTLSGGSGNDLLDGGADADSIIGGAGSDSILGGSGNDSIDGGADADTLFGGAGDDTIEGGSGNDIIDGGTENDVLRGGDGADVILGQSGNDVLEGGEGDDQLFAHSGDDTLDGGAGNDTIHGGIGNDTLTGGTGNDTFVYAPGDGLDVITDFNTGNTGAINDGDTTNNDVLDLSTSYDHLFELWADQADDGILNQSNTLDTQGNAVDYSDNTQFEEGEGIIVQGATADRFFFNQDNTGVVCFASGSLIRTPHGMVPVELLNVGDMVITRDNGPQPILWAGYRALDRAALERTPNLKPIWLSGQYFGLERDLIVSPQHGVLLHEQERGGTETLFRARHLADINGGGARVMKNCKNVTYHHLMFAEHQTISANGMWSESLYPGMFALASLAQSAQREILSLFPELRSGDVKTAYGPTATAYSKRRNLPESTRELMRAS